MTYADDNCEVDDEIEEFPLANVHVGVIHSTSGDTLTDLITTGRAKFYCRHTTGWLRSLRPAVN